jgi:hypothetical protein
MGSASDTTWWTLGEVVKWVQAIDPAATVWQIRIGLEVRCASGRIRSHGRRWVYRYDPPLWIDHGDRQFVLFSDEYGSPQSSFDAIPAYEWKDLTFFARPTPEMDRQYEVALEQALAQLVSPVELRSLSKHRLAWRDVEFWRADVIREWSQASPPRHAKRGWGRTAIRRCRDDGGRKPGIENADEPSRSTFRARFSIVVQRASRRTDGTRRDLFW